MVCGCSTSTDHGLYIFTYSTDGTRIENLHQWRPWRKSKKCHLDCTHYITTQHEGLKFTSLSTNNNSPLDLTSVKSQSIDAGELMCPPWYQRNKCHMGATFKGIVASDNDTMLQRFYCMTRQKCDKPEWCYILEVVFLIHWWYTLYVLSIAM